MTIGPGPRARRAGFTLLEMLVVLTILSLLGALVLSRGPSRSAGLEMRLAADTIAQTFRLARARAMASDSATRIVFDNPTSTMRLSDGISRRLPPGLSVVVTRTAAPVDGPRGAILFLPDGSSNGGEVELLGGGQHATVVVNWLTGQVTVNAGS